MEFSSVIKVFVVLLSAALPCFGEYHLQIVAPERVSAQQDLQIAMDKGERAVRSQRISTSMFYISNQYPNPDEIINFFCDAVFPYNSSVILSINYNSETSRASSYIADIASKFGYPVISWDPVFTGSLSVSIYQAFSMKLYIYYK